MVKFMHAKWRSKSQLENFSHITTKVKGRVQKNDHNTGSSSLSTFGRVRLIGFISSPDKSSAIPQFAEREIWLIQMWSVNEGIKIKFNKTVVFVDCFKHVTSHLTFL